MNSDTWLVIAGVGAITFLTRASFIVFADPRRFPETLRTALTYVPAAVLSAIVVPGLVMPQGHLDIGPGNLRLLAGLVAIVVAARTRNTFVSILSGMASLWALQWAAG